MKYFSYIVQYTSETNLSFGHVSVAIVGLSTEWETVGFRHWGPLSAARFEYLLGSEECYSPLALAAVE